MDRQHTRRVNRSQPGVVLGTASFAKDDSVCYHGRVA